MTLYPVAVTNPLCVPLRVVVVALAFAGATAGCGTADEDDPSICGPENNSYETEDGDCLCEARADWVSPDDRFDYRCEPVDVSCREENNSLYDDSGVCICVAGYLWATDDGGDFRCVPES